jgi:hypothetical protein
MRGILIILILPVLFFSCDKESKIRYKFAGVWNMTELEVEYFTNNTLDSSYSDSDLGTWLLTDNGATTFNDFHFIHTKTPPPSFSSFAIAGGLSFDDDYASWYSDATTDNRFTIHKELYIGAVYVIYTVLEMKKNKLVLQYVQADSSNPEYLKYKEVITFKRD